MDADDLATELRAVHADEATRRPLDEAADEWIECWFCEKPIASDEFGAHLEDEHD